MNPFYSGAATSLERLCVRLLEKDSPARSVFLHGGPFSGDCPPRWIRVRRLQRRFTSWAEWRESGGDWWVCKPCDTPIPPVCLDPQRSLGIREPQAVFEFPDAGSLPMCHITWRSRLLGEHEASLSTKEKGVDLRRRDRFSRFCSCADKHYNEYDSPKESNRYDWCFDCRPCPPDTRYAVLPDGRS